MKIKSLLPTIVLGILFMLAIFLGVEYKIRADEGRRYTFNELLGSYVIDLNKTKLGNEYTKDSNIYKSLSITFFPDSTFKMNKQVPFMYDSAGRWKAGNVNEWCWLLFANFKYGYNDEHPGSQFTRPYEEGSDTFFLINAATPRDNRKTISSIYFKKVKYQK